MGVAAADFSFPSLLGQACRQTIVEGGQMAITNFKGGEELCKELEILQPAPSGQVREGMLDRKEQALLFTIRHQGGQVASAALNVHVLPLAYVVDAHLRFG